MMMTRSLRGDKEKKKKKKKKRTNKGYGRSTQLDICHSSCTFGQHTLLGLVVVLVQSHCRSIERGRGHCFPSLDESKFEDNNNERASYLLERARRSREDDHSIDRYGDDRRQCHDPSRIFCPLRKSILLVSHGFVLDKTEYGNTLDERRRHSLR